MDWTLFPFSASLSKIVLLYGFIVLDFQLIPFIKTDILSFLLEVLGNLTSHINPSVSPVNYLVKI